MFSFSNISRNTEDHSNDYAVIISGGYSKQKNYERYYNDCAAIYSALRYVYHYQRDHILVIMSDGTNPAKDRLNIAQDYVLDMVRFYPCQGYSI